MSGKIIAYSYTNCFLAGVAGYGLSRLPILLFPGGSKVDEDMTTRVGQVLRRINLCRNWTRMQLDNLSLSSRKWHFLSTSIKDNLPLVSFIFALAAKRMASEEAMIHGISLKGFQIKNFDKISSIASLIIVTCTILHLSRIVTYKWGNQLIDHVQGRGAPSQFLIIVRSILARLAPSAI